MALKTHTQGVSASSTHHPLIFNTATSQRYISLVYKAAQHEASTHTAMGLKRQRCVMHSALP